MSETTVTRKIGYNREKSRLWIEGTCLLAMKWNHGDRFDISYHDGEIRMWKCANGKRKVAGDPSRPVIDTNTDKITESIKCKPGEPAKLVIEDGMITVTKAPPGLAEKLKQTANKGIVTALALTASLAPLAPNQATAFVTGAKRFIVGCEYSGRVRDALIAQGHDAISCDLDPSDSEGPPHFQGDIMELLEMECDGLIVFPPCTFLTCSALWRNRLKYDPTGNRARKTEAALHFVAKLLNARNIKQKALENPQGCISTRLYRDEKGIVQVRPLAECDGTPTLPHTQIIHPWQYGHPESKRTLLWLEGFPELEPTDILKIEEHGHQNPETGKWYWQNQTATGQNRMTPSADRGKKRSLTYSGIADAMGIQWGRITKPRKSHTPRSILTLLA